MNKSSFLKRGRSIIRGMMAAPALVALCFAGCGEKDSSPTEVIPPFDPSQPVVISDFTPKEGGVGQRLIIYGQNFGNDTALVRVFIGGKEAKVVGVKGEYIYCVVPQKAFAGDIELRIGDRENPTVVAVETPFAYQRKTVVSTLFGYKKDDDSQGSGVFPNGDSNSKFHEVALFKEDSWLRFDPLNPDHLYMSFDNAALTRIVFSDSLWQRVMTKAAGGFSRLRSVDFTLDGQHMILADDRSGINDRSTMIARRDNDFRSTTVLTTYKNCNGASIHPVNGEMYFNSYEKGQFYRLDLTETTYFGGTKGVKDYDELFKIQDNNWEFNIRIHPTGEYAYIVVCNQHYILRTDYNWDMKRFNQPYLVCGEAKQSGYLDGVGASVRLARPYQGVFVKNPDYAGTEDEYDFYFTDCNNHCIRILQPDGVVTTFAGRGSTGLNASFNGFVEGDLRLEARFDQPTGLAYDEASRTFYVGDRGNRRVRKIAPEPMDEEEEEEEPAEEETPEE
jgi:hypothetical protein